MVANYVIFLNSLRFFIFMVSSFLSFFLFGIFGDFDFTSRFAVLTTISRRGFSLAVVLEVAPSRFLAVSLGGVSRRYLSAVSLGGVSWRYLSAVFLDGSLHEFRSYSGFARSFAFTLFDIFVRDFSSCLQIVFTLTGFAILVFFVLSSVCLWFVFGLSPIYVRFVLVSRELRHKSNAKEAQK